jgi:hypothetical protein
VERLNITAKDGHLHNKHTEDRKMNFKTDKLFLELVAAHKAGLKIARKPGNRSAYAALIQKQMNLQEKLMRQYDVSFIQLNGAMISA